MSNLIIINLLVRIVTYTYRVGYILHRSIRTYIENLKHISHVIGMILF